MIERPGRHEGGQASAEVLLISATVLMAVLVIIIRTWAVIDTKFRVVGAAREAVRAYVEAPTADRANEDALRAALRAMDRDSLDELPIARDRFFRREGGFERCERIRITVRWEVPAIRAWIVRFGAVTVTGTQTEVVDPFRNGRTGPAECGGDAP